MQKNNKEQFESISQKLSKLLVQLNEENEKNTFKDYEKNLNNLINQAEKYINNLNDGVSDERTKEIEEEVNLAIEKISGYEETLIEEKKPELERLTHKANGLYRNLQTILMTSRITNLNNKLEVKIKNIEESMSSMLFTVISIFLGISVTSAMVTGLEYISPEFILFYFLSCAWIALTILAIAALLLKNDINKNLIYKIYIIYTIMWLTIGIISYNTYNKNNEEHIIEKIYYK